MKKLKKVTTNLKDSIEVYAGVCDCAPNCSQVACSCTCDPSYQTYSSAKSSVSGSKNYENLADNGVSASYSSVFWS